LIIAGVVTGCLLVIVLVAGRPARNAVLALQARKHARRAFAFIDQQKWKNARDEATAAYRLRPNEPEALRAVARLLSRAGQADGLEYWRKLSAITPLTDEDLRDNARIALRGNDLPAANDAVDQLLADHNDKDRVADYLVAAEVAARQHDYRKTAQYDQKILADPTATHSEQLRATLRLDSIVRSGGRMFVDDPKKIDERLVALASGDDQTSLDALTALAQHVLSPASETKTDLPVPIGDLISKIENHPKATIGSHLLATDLEISQAGSNREQIVQRATDRWKNSPNEGVATLGSWLYHHGDYQRELEVISLDRAMQTRELFLERIDALAALERWNEIAKLLESERYPLEPVIQNMYLAMCYSKQGEKISADNGWQRAIESAAGDLNKLLMLGSFAEHNGVGSVATTAYNAAVAVSPKSLEAQLGRLRVLRAGGDTHKIHSTVQELLKIWPNDPNLQNDEMYLRLLLLPPDTKPDSIELKSIKTAAEKLVADEPNSLPQRTVLALALLKQNQPYTALSLYRNLAVVQSAVTPATIAIHAAVLNAAGQTNEAKAEAAKVPRDKLLPEERALIQPL
jgi:cytochrome c-type biogenesis protein CcmH/NrfG